MEKLWRFNGEIVEMVKFVVVVTFGCVSFQLKLDTLAGLEMFPSKYQVFGCDFLIKSDFLCHFGLLLPFKGAVFRTLNILQNRARRLQLI